MTTLIGPPPSGPGVVARNLLEHVDDLTGELVERIRTGDHAYAESTLLTDDLLRTVVHDNLAAVLCQLAGVTGRRLTPAISAGRMKAELGLPLAALLHAYRLAGRLIWERSLLTATGSDRADLPTLGADVWRLIDDYSSAAADSYSNYLSEQATRADLGRQELLRALFRAGIDGPPVPEITRALHLPDLGMFLVAYAEVDPGGDEPLAGIESRLRAQFVHSVWMTEPGVRVGLLVLNGPRAQEQALAQLERGTRGRVGVSRIFPTPSAAGAALREAELAARCLRPGTPALMIYGSTPVPTVLAHAPLAAQEMAEDILGAVLDLPDEEREVLLDTLELWFEHGGSNIAVANQLHYHRNTIHQRLRRIETLTGRRCSDPKSAAELYFALHAARLHGL
ncbi:helix-turn-helix domain-containing protein [Nocardia sp. NPDC005825]|uniref:PucR family transcriptional regulator n=1 Tax=unclassified Nocardia TaxID=2637762 RepID=UPI0033F7D328